MPVGPHSPVGKCVSPKLGRDTRATDGCEKERERRKKCMRKREKEERSAYEKEIKVFVHACVCYYIYTCMWIREIVSVSKSMCLEEREK